MQRNKAVKLADMARRCGVSYDDAFFGVVNALCGALCEMLPIILNEGGAGNEP